MVLGVLTVGARVAPATSSTTYGYFYVSGHTAYTGVTPGAAIDVALYLQETNSDGSGNSLLQSEDGLFAGGVSVAFAASSGASATTITGIRPNSGSPTTGFDDIRRPDLH
jgi:hypothetical protein